MKEIIIIGFGPAKENFDKTVSLLGETFRIKRLGVDFNFKLARELVKQYHSECDILSLSGFPIDMKIDGKIHTHDQVAELRNLAGSTPISDGSNLRALALPLILKNFTLADPHFFKGKTIGFYSGISQWDYISSYHEVSKKLIFADIFAAKGIPKLIRGSNELKSFLRMAIPFLKKINLEGLKQRNFNALQSKLGTMKDFFNADIFVVNESQLDYIQLQDLSGKTVIMDRVGSFAKKKLIDANASKVYSCFPDLPEIPQMGFSVLEAMFMAHTGKNKLDQDDVLDLVDELKLTSEVFKAKLEINGEVERFSFIIHPLSRPQLFSFPVVKHLLKTPAAPRLEQMMAKAPGFHYGSITGIKSIANGKEVQGELYAVPMTPKVMLKQNPESFYEVLHKICVQAAQKGSKIIGLGAYTKIVGDAGVTVNNNSPIPVTTGNSLSSSATLWAASFAVEKMNLIGKENGRYEGTAMIIGATGSIGKVCARILANQWKRIIIAAPRPYKILELVQELKALNPGVEIIGTSSPDRYSPECDLIITSTSAQGEAVMDMSKVKPGCVICDVSRPFDISLDDASSRPDVLVVASGEVTLPGNVHLTHTLHLPGNSVYACLAETALLAMEGRFESFSISRDLSYERVVEIDKLSRKHGVRLSAIMGHTGEISEEDIQLCREHALKARALQAKA